MQDYGQLIRTHRESGADITICTNSVDWDMATRRGLARVNAESGSHLSLVSSMLIMFVPLRMLTVRLPISGASWYSVKARQAPLIRAVYSCSALISSISATACLAPVAEHAVSLCVLLACCDDLTDGTMRAGLVESFVEKPTGDRLEMLAHASKHATPEFPFEASMGIYVFKCASGALSSCCLSMQIFISSPSHLRPA